MKAMEKMYLYTRFERFWHWAQAALISVLALTGFELHGSFTLFGFERAHDIHEFCAWSWVVLWAFIVFWIITTGEWRQYVPTTRKVIEVARYYAIGIFRGEAHPVPKTTRAKHNPLQRLTYLSLAALLLPVQMGSGLLYMFFNDWPALGLTGVLSLDGLAFVHTALAFALVAFIVIHVYMTTTGHSVWAHITAMFTGWEEVEDADAVQEWERKTERF
ncbi:thiosulfate reductase cytochrome b subunit [Desulfobaculum xiamenense]|uniref:Thiosulfate reductase cytochrome b subunit n=1 Tax=Desulfobaculum xiamenense TaxID=995050 RepID=A0A846QRY6_9BACT|nr:cytochrome b/b6 domain-containing protein [Desulfobaculum xiamenense]NJB67429.1 thiosulfate reductase cytochrome b subunit [Desulfobaculum xiamenense]